MAWKLVTLRTLGNFPDLADPEHLAGRYDGVLNG